MKKTIQIVILLLFVLSANAQDVFYVRCIDADNLEHVSEYTISTPSKKVRVGENNNGIVQLTNLKKGTEITITADNYIDEMYRRASKRDEIAMKYNGSEILKPGDTILIELSLNNELLRKRWDEEDALYSNIDTTNLATEPDTKASFINEQDFISALGSKLHFPQHVINENVQGTVYLSAIVETDGSLSNIRIARSLEPHLDRIALRALRSNDLPKMIPATKDNNSVRSKIVIPVKFNLY